MGAAFRNLNPDLHITVVLNAGAPQELGECAPDLRLSFLYIDPSQYQSATWDAAAPKELKYFWDYVFILRNDSHVTWKSDGGLRRFHALFRTNIKASMAMNMWGRIPPSFPHAKSSTVSLTLPQSAFHAAASIAPKSVGKRICILTGSSTEGKAPSVQFWDELIVLLTQIYPDADFVLIGKLTATYPTLNVSHADLLLLASRHSSVRLAFDAAFLTQLALAAGSSLLISPHSGMAFAIQCVGVPWLALSGGPLYEYFLNNVPFRCVYPACPA